MYKYFILLLSFNLLVNAKTNVSVTPLLEIESQSIITIASVRLGIPSHEIADELISIIRRMAQAILRADHTTVEEMLAAYECPSRTKHQCTKKGETAHKETFIQELIKKNIATATSDACSTAANLLKACATQLPLRAGHELFKAVQTTQAKLSCEKESDESYDNVIRATPLLHCAHRVAVDAITRLLIVLFSPKVLASQRMRALFILNHCSLMGKKGRYFYEFMARTNRYYFNQHGSIRSYDPSESSHTIKRRVKELARIFALLSSHEVHYSSLVYEAQRQGIGAILYIPRSRGQWKIKAKKFFWNYTTDIIKHIAGFDLSEVRTVDPVKVKQKQLTRDFMHYMEELAQIEKNVDIDYSSFKQQGVAALHRYVEKYRALSSVTDNHMFIDIFTRYYLDTLRLFKK